MKRCAWAECSDLMRAYHDNEWGKPCRDDQTLFEFLLLEGAQAGLSWETVLNKREGYRKAFDNFDYQKIARYSDEKCEELRQNPAIIRNRLKIRSAVQNAQAFMRVQEEFGSFSSYIWSFVDNTPIVNHFKSLDELPAKTPLAEKISKDLKKRGFNFVGPTICYAYMQAIGMVDDHEVDCVVRN